MDRISSEAVVKKAVEKIIDFSYGGEAVTDHEVTFSFRLLTREEFLMLARAQKLGHALELEIRFAQAGLKGEGGSQAGRNIAANGSREGAER